MIRLTHARGAVSFNCDTQEVTKQCRCGWSSGALSSFEAATAALEKHIEGELRKLSRVQLLEIAIAEAMGG